MTGDRLLGRALGVLAATTVALSSTAARADNGGVGFWLPGGMGSLAAVPGQPGWSLSTLYVHLDAKAEGGTEFQKNASIVAGLHARADALAILPSYTFA